MTFHNLKINPKFFDAVLNGAKPWECREDPGHKFAVGDSVCLNEFETVSQEYTGRSLLGRITYICRDSDFKGIRENYVVFSIELMGFDDGVKE